MDLGANLKMEFLAEMFKFAKIVYSIARKMMCLYRRQLYAV
jgi:hypothetical protein